MPPEVSICPEETRTFLTRVQRFQERLEMRQGKEWWSAANVLRRHDPFAACPEKFLSACGALMRVRYVLPGERIVEEGDSVEKALIIETGCAKVHRQTRPGLRGCPDRTGEVQDSYLIGGISGAFTFAGMQLRLATIHALTICKIVFFTGETIIKQGDAADSMIIISPASVVTIFVDGRKLKELTGGCTLGAKGRFQSLGTGIAGIETMIHYDGYRRLMVIDEYLRIEGPQFWLMSTVVNDDC
eukprot:Skav214842  [mRNA]  locus=scaffold16:21375:25069:+ [translate_table: standard]